MENSLAKFNELVKGIRFVMLTTIGEDNNLKSRPMAAQEQESDGDVWFFTSSDTDKAKQIMKDNRVNLAYANPSKNTWVSVAGTGSISTDRVMMEKLWSTPMKAWFPEELETPNICLLKVTAESAEYWDSPSAKVIHLYGIAKAALTGESPRGGENETLKF